MEALISIIVPIYNVEKYLKRCINSIRSQTYQKLEIILVDDGSPDNCGKICDDYALLDERIKVLHKKNGGLSDARNAGLNIAIGDYIGFVDSDDYINSQMYEILYKNISETESDISVCRFDWVNIETSGLSQRKNNVTIFDKYESLGRLFTYSCLDLTLTWNKLYKRSLFNDIRFPKGKIREDEFTTYKLLYLSQNVVLTEKSLYYYMQTPNSIMRSGKIQKELYYAEAFEERILFFKEKGLHDFYITALKRYSLWLLSSFIKFNNELSNNPAAKAEFKKKAINTITTLKKEYQLPLISLGIYTLAQKFTELIGILAYQKLYGFNFASPAIDWLFDEYNRFNYVPNRTKYKNAFTKKIQ